MPMQNSEARRSRFAPPEERRRQLIQATLQVVAERGLTGTKVSDVTERAGLSVGAVNHHFKSKEELLTATLAYLAEELQAQWYPVFLDTEFSPADRLGAIVDHLYDPMVCTPVKIAVWFAFFGDAHYRQVYRDMVKAFDHKRTAAIARISRALKEEGGYAEADPETIAQSVESLADGLWLALLLYPERITREAARQQTRALLATHFPRHFDISADDAARNHGPDQCLGVQ
jgi:TetR/AcrR family transcriptional repressor of bet genes